MIAGFVKVSNLRSVKLSSSKRAQRITPNQKAERAEVWAFTNQIGCRLGRRARELARLGWYGFAGWSRWSTRVRRRRWDWVCSKWKLWKRIQNDDDQTLNGTIWSDPRRRATRAHRVPSPHRRLLRYRNTELLQTNIAIAINKVKRTYEK